MSLEAARIREALAFINGDDGPDTWNTQAKRLEDASEDYASMVIAYANTLMDAALAHAEWLEEQERSHEP